jgi:hypothetical protein
VAEPPDVKTVDGNVSEYVHDVIEVALAVEWRPGTPTASAGGVIFLTIGALELSAPGLLSNVLEGLAY